MSDPCFHSLHLEGLPRREQFRVAREQLQAACGHQTLAGELAMLDAPSPRELIDSHQATATAPPLADQTFWLQDGERLHPLNLGINSVGRLPDNAVVLRDEHVSRRHCAIVVHRDGRCEVHDIASKNGTLLNGKKINGPTRIRPGDTILLCTRKLVFLTGNSPSPMPVG